MTGGVFVRFHVGGSGGSSAHLRYISRPAAVRDGLEGVRLRHLPDAAAERTFVLLRDQLLAFAWLRERAERQQGRGSRTFYRAVLGFEVDIGSRPALALVGKWLAEVFPQAQTATFLHRDTPRLHAHVWINARDTQGRKLQIGHAQFRSLDEVWNHLYARTMGHAVDEHLAKKNETRWTQRLSLPAPERENYEPERAWFHGQELRNAGHTELKNELEKDGFGGIEPAASGRAAPTAERERTALGGESAALRSVAAAHDTDRAADRAVSETRALRDDASRLDSREKMRREKQHAKERDR